MGTTNSTTLTNWVETNVDIKSAINLKTVARANDTVIDTQKNSLVLNSYVPSSCCGNVKSSAADYTACLAAIKESASQANGVCGGSLNITQVIGAKDLQTAKADAQMTANIVNSVNTAMANRINDVVKQYNSGGFLGSLLQLGDKNDTNVSNHIQQSIKTTITENLTTSAINNVRNLSGQNNNTAINICFGMLSSKDCNISQDATFNVYQNNLAGSVANITAQNKDANTIFNGIKNSSTNKNQSFIQSILGSLSKTEKLIFGIVIVVAAISLIVALIWMAHGHNSYPPMYPPPGGGVPNLIREMPPMRVGVGGESSFGRFGQNLRKAAVYGAEGAELAAV